MQATSTLRTRFEASGLASQLLSFVKASLGVEVALLQGGAVRGKASYEAQQAFTFGDLMKDEERELSFIGFKGN